MKLAKSLLLGSAAALAAAAGAQAADLPIKKAAPVDYVRVCEWTAAAGPGFFYIPGTDTCLRISGAVRAEYAYISNERSFVSPAAGGGYGTVATGAGAGTLITGRNRDVSGFFARGKLEADARTQTAYGTLRTFIRFQADRGAGSQGGEIAQPGFPTGPQSATYLDKGYIQFGPITAGRVQSAFDFGADPYGFDGVATSDASTQAFQYTATFGGGFSGTLSVEDNAVRRDGIANRGTAAGGAGAAPVGPGYAVAYAGEEIPDIVGQLNVTQGWGQAQIAAVYHQLNTTSSNNTFSKTDDGFAVRGGLQVKLPMFGPGDEFQIEAGWERGAYSYQNSNGINEGYSGLEIGGYRHGNFDAVAIPAAGGRYTLSKVEGYSISGGIVHYFTPQWSDTVFGSYDHASYGKGAGAAPWYLGGVGAESEYRIANQINWYPVKGLQIGLETMYMHLDQKIPGTPGSPVAGFATVALPAGITKNPDSFVARVRIERGF